MVTLIQRSGNVSKDPNERIGKLRQDQFAFEEFSVIDTVIMGHAELWEVKEGARPHLRSLAGDERRGWHESCRTRGTNLPRWMVTQQNPAPVNYYWVLDIPIEQHFGPMSEVAPGWKLRVLLAQALFADPDIMLLDEPTNNLDINTIRWLEGVLNERNSTMIIISHDRHFLNSVCTHMADLDYGELRLYPRQL